MLLYHNSEMNTHSSKQSQKTEKNNHFLQPTSSCLPLPAGGPSDTAGQEGCMPREMATHTETHTAAPAFCYQINLHENTSTARKACFRDFHSLYICTRTWALSWHSQLLIRVREKEEEDKKTKEKGYEDIRTANRTTPHRSASR